jgi:hypothetical protein
MADVDSGRPQAGLVRRLDVRDSISSKQAVNGRFWKSRLAPAYILTLTKS